jgi:biotin carboxylase
MIKILMIALNGSFLSSLDSSKYEVYLLEEKEIYDAKPERYEYPIIKEIRFGEYQQSEGFLDIAISWHKEVKFDAIIPGLEYAVEPAQILAEKIGLPNPGRKATNTFTNKQRLRECCVKAGIPHPRFQKVNSIDDVYSFYDGKPIIIKPANRRSSIGVIRVNSLREIEDAWLECTSVDEGYRTVKSRPLNWEYIVEEYMEGIEVSVETLVYDYKPIFHNVTCKKTTNGPHFVELSHTVPAQISENEKTLLLNNKEKLLDYLNVKMGVFHSEWKLTNEGPKIIECAARAPGDYIPKLINIAYDFNFYEAFVQIFSGIKPAVNKTNKRVARVEYFNPPEGVIEDIQGLSYLESIPQLVSYQIQKNKGEVVPPLLSSMDRIGQYIISADTYEELEEITNNITKQVKFIIR